MLAEELKSTKKTKTLNKKQNAKRHNKLKDGCLAKKNISFASCRVLATAQVLAEAAQLLVKERHNVAEQSFQHRNSWTKRQSARRRHKCSLKRHKCSATQCSQSFQKSRKKTKHATKHKCKAKKQIQKHNKIRGGVEFRINYLLSLLKGKFMFRVSLLWFRKMKSKKQNKIRGGWNLEQILLSHLQDKLLIRVSLLWPRIMKPKNNKVSGGWNLE